MSHSPFEFVKNFEKLEHQYDALPLNSLKIILCAEFWETMVPVLEMPMHTHHVQIYSQNLTECIKEDFLQDTHIEVLRKLINITEKLSLPELTELCKKQLITIFCYVGGYTEALTVYYGHDALDKKEAVKKVFTEAICTVNPQEQLSQICIKLKDVDRDVYQYFSAILGDWYGLTDVLSGNKVYCLFVLQDEFKNNQFGCMAELTGAVDLFPKSITNDEVSIKSGPVQSDDSAFGVVYNSFEAIRQIFSVRTFHRISNRFYHGHFSLNGYEQRLSGDSIGLAAGLLTYTQLLKTEIQRHERFLSGEVAFTGSVDPEGKIQSVNGESLMMKIERAFYSHVKFVALPEKNYKKAKEVVEKLKERYPNRHLHLIPLEHLNDALEDKNIIRSEKVCLGEYASKKAYKYVRMTRLQIPLLLGMIYLLICLVYPKAWIWFDWHIAGIEIVGNRFQAVNPQGQHLFWSEEFDQKLHKDKYIQKLNQSTYYTEDIDGKWEDELFIVVFTNPKTKHSGSLKYYHNGKLKWNKYVAIDTKDSYGIDKIIPFKDSVGNTYISIVSHPSNSYFLQVSTFDVEGNLVSGPYMHRGQIKDERAFKLNIEGEEKLFLLTTNNELNMAGLVVLDPFDLKGISPPFVNMEIDGITYEKGSQEYYIGFPELEISKGNDVRNWVLNLKYNADSKTYEVRVLEGDRLIAPDGLHYNEKVLPELTYILNSNFIPLSVKFQDGKIGQYENILQDLGIINQPHYLSEIYDSLISNVYLLKDTVQILPQFFQ